MNTFEHLLYDALVDALAAAWKAAEAANQAEQVESVREAA